MTYHSVFRSDLFGNQVAVVTGGGSGIGRCVAHELASLGARVMLVSRNEEKLARVADEIREDGGVAAYRVADIRDEEAVSGAVAATIEIFGRIDHLVNNAGGQYATPAASISKKGWEAVIASNLTGGFLVARECYLQWMQHHGGAIVNMVADMWNGMPNMAHSGAARAGMVNFTMTAALEWGAANVRVNAVAPGLVFSSGVETYPPEVRELLLAYPKDVPLGRVGTEAEVSGAITYLLSPAAAYVSGATIAIDGGFAMSTPNYRIPPRTEPSPVFEGFHRAVPPSFVTSPSKA